MTQKQMKRAYELFDELARVDPEERENLLRERCGDDEELFNEVAALLEHAGSMDEATMSLEKPRRRAHAEPGHGAARGAELQPGDRVGSYVIRERLGEGGFAVVYSADQQEPVKRKVALKIIKLGMDTKQVIARFGAERQALAMMDHPHVATVYDAGSTDTGRTSTH